MPGEIWDELIYPFPKSNDVAIKLFDYVSMLGLKLINVHEKWLRTWSSFMMTSSIRPRNKIQWNIIEKYPKEANLMCANKAHQSDNDADILKPKRAPTK